MPSILDRFGLGNQQKISEEEPLQNGNQPGNDDATGKLDNSGKGKNQQEDENDPIFGDIFGKQESNDDFDLPDDLLNPKKVGEDDTNSDDDQDKIDPSVGLKTKMQEILSSAVVRVEDIPADLDVNDPKSLSGFLTKNNQKAIQQAVGLMALPVQHAIEQLEQRMQDAMNSGIRRGSVQQQVEAAFSPIRDALKSQKDPSVINMAKMSFQSALKVTKDPKKAAAATARMVEGLMGIKINMRNRGSSGGNQSDDNGSAPSFKSGAEALDDLFKM